MAHPLVTAYEERRKASGIPADHVHKRSGVSASTVWRWLNESVPPNLGSLEKLNTALDELIAEKESANG